MDEINKNETRFRLLDRLWEIGAVRCDGIALKTGEISPVYFNLRLVVSDPELLIALTNEMMIKAEEFGKPLPKLICGVPYAALPFATCAAIQKKNPMIFCRKEKKEYSTKQIIEGKYNKGDECLVIEDVTAFGTSLGEFSEVLRSEGLNVNKAVVLIDREQDAIINLKDNFKLDVKSVFSLSEILDYFNSDGKIPEVTVSRMKEFVKRNTYKNL